MEVRLLGPLEAVVGDTPLRLGGRRQRALLARLVLDLNRTVSVDRLVDDLWGEDVPETAVKMVHIYVSQLRKVLPDGALVTRSPGYALELEPESLDLSRFDALRDRGRVALAAGDAAAAAASLEEALALWRGPALAEFNEPFAVAEAARLEDLRLACLEDRIDADLAVGKDAELVGELEVLVARQPLRERLRQLLMVALYRSGRQVEALVVYRDFRRMLRDELGIEPSAGLRALEGRILRQEETAPARGPRLQSTPSGPVLIGRLAELDRLHQALEEALAGSRRLVFITGDAGLGKTSLADRFLADSQAELDLLVGVGQCLEQTGGGEAYLPLIDAIGRLCRAADDVVPLVARHAPTWLSQMPWLADGEPPAPGASMLLELLELLDAAAAGRPLILLIEDLHWSDLPTIELLAAFARRSTPARVLIIGTARRDELHGHPLDRALAELRVRGLCEEIALDPLGEDALAEYLVHRFPEGGFPAELPRILKERTGGNPLYVENLLGSLDGDRWSLDGLPDSLRRLIERRLERLPEDDQALLSAASVAGPEFSTLALTLGDRTLDEAELRCEALARRGELITATGAGRWADGTVATTYRFSHELYHAVLYDRLSPGRRASLHRRIGARLEQAGHGSRELAAELSSHFVRARDAERAVHYLRLAAERALQRGAEREAIRHLEDATAMLSELEEGPERDTRELEVQVMLANALMAVRGYAAPEVAAGYGRARELCEALGDDLQLLPVLFGLTTNAFDRGRHHEALGVAREFLRIAEERGHPAALAAHTQIGWALLSMGDPAAAREHLRAAAGLHEQNGTDRLGPLYGAEAGIGERAPYAWASWLLGDTEQALAMSGEAVSRAESATRGLTRAYALGCDAPPVQSRLRRHPPPGRGGARRRG
jgi:DNA-binding SARP family transcriptional activator/type II secretory pathway predicted ATPase ExeA/TPR repeat protein